MFFEKGTIGGMYEFHYGYIKNIYDNKANYYLQTLTV